MSWISGVIAVVLFSAAVAAAASIPLAVQRQVVAVQQLLDQQQYDQALQRLGPDGQPTDHYLLDFCRANAYLLSQRPAQAVPWLQRVVAKQADYTPGWLNLAQALYLTEDYRAAAQAFERSYALKQPPNPTLLYNAALAYLQGEQPQAALTVLLRLLDRPPQQVDTSWRAALVQVYLQLDQPHQALPQLEILAEQTHGLEQRRWREVLVQQLMAVEQLAAALNHLNRYIDDDGLHVTWWRLLTHLQLEAQRYAEGLVALTVVGYLQPLSAEETRLLADLHLSLGVPRQAQHYYEQLVVDQPHDRVLLTRLAHASLNQHQPQQALHWTQQPAAQNDPALLHLQGQLLFSLQRYHEASALFGRLAKESDNPGPLWLMQGYAAWNGEQWALARQALNKAQDYPAQRKQARLLLEQLKERTP